MLRIDRQQLPVLQREISLTDDSEPSNAAQTPQLSPACRDYSTFRHLVAPHLRAASHLLEVNPGAFLTLDPACRMPPRTVLRSA